MTARLFHWFVLVWLPVSTCWAQEEKQPPAQTEEYSRPDLPDAPIANAPAEEQRPPRIFWIIPTFTITESKTPTRLTSRQKLDIVVKNAIDPYTIGSTAFTAGILQAKNDMSGYGQGASGYGKRFGALYADQASGGFFSGFLLPSLLHQDPRYYRQGSGPFTHRFAHALIRPVVTYSDANGRQFNWSGLLGSLAASGLSNTYYPDNERGAGKTFSRWGMGIPFSVIDHLVDEFGPDLQHMIAPKKRRAEN